MAPRPSSRNGRRWVAATALIVVAAAVFFLWQSESREGLPGSASGAGSEHSQALSEDPIAVRAAPVTTRSLTRSITINAQVAPVREVTIAPKISGTVRDVTVDVGHRVEVGQVILRLDDEELAAQFEQASAALDLAEANLARLLAGATEEEREQVAASLRQAQLNVEQASRQLKRLEQLFEDGAITREQLDGARTAFGIAQAQYESALQQSLRVERGATEEELRAARAQVSQAKAARDLAGLQLAYAEAKAPFSGLISRRDVEPGGLVQAGSPAAVLVDIDRVYVRGTVSQAYVNRVRAGETVAVEVPTAGESFTGRIHSISPAVDHAGLFPLRVEIDNTGHTLKPGMFATVRIPVARADDALAVPGHAIVRRGEERAVYVIEPMEGRDRVGTARLRIVELGVEEGEWVQIVDGVRDGEWVVAAGHAFLSDGRSVTWVPEE